MSSQYFKATGIIIIIIIITIIITIFVVAVLMFQNHKMIVTILGYCWCNGGATQSPSCWSSCSVWWKMSAEDGGW